MILVTYCRLRHNKSLHCVAASPSCPDIHGMLLIGSSLYRHAVITTPGIHYIIGTFCSRITFSYVVFDCTHVQANLWHLPSFVVIIPSLPPPTSLCPWLITYNGFYDSNFEFVDMEGVQMLGPWPCLFSLAATPSPPNWPVWSASAPWATLTVTSWRPSTAHTSLLCARQH